MKRYTKVTLGIYKPIKVDHVEDQLFGTIERTNEIKYRYKRAIFYKNGVYRVYKYLYNLNWGDTWAKGYFNHPNKELCTTDTEEMVNYFKKYYNGYNAYKERLIEELISYKKQADKDCKEKGLVLISWSDNE